LVWVLDGAPVSVFSSALALVSASLVAGAALEVDGVVAAVEVQKVAEVAVSAWGVAWASSLALASALAFSVGRAFLVEVRVAGEASVGVGF